METVTKAVYGRFITNGACQKKKIQTLIVNQLQMNPNPHNERE
jgi:hypothetical protein